ncbi:nitrate- and nitrite sensing domain-containing protein [Streptomyces sp. NPDC048156]|uniref:sensor histidine kinase n=1 Tax=Streptomyces sp. NPDC048156 TaxID=3365502 RepID=UPI003715C004
MRARSSLGRLRPKSVRAKIVALLMVPIISLMALWAFATVSTARNVSELAQFKDVDATLLTPVDTFVSAVQDERSAAARNVAAPGSERAAALREATRATDASARKLRDSIATGTFEYGALHPELPRRIDQLLESAGALPGLRKQVSGVDASYRAYTAVVESGFAVREAVASSAGVQAASPARVLLELARAREMLAREDALLGAAQAAGRMSRAQQTEITGAVHTRRDLLAAVDDLRPVDRDAYRTVLAGEDYRALRSAEDAVLQPGSGTSAAAAVSTSNWEAHSHAVEQQLRRVEAGAGNVAAARLDPYSFDVLGGSGIAVVLGLAGVLLSLLISVRIGRALVVELVDLRNDALRLAGHELPAAIEKLQQGGQVDIDAPVPVRRRGADEIGQVGSALVAVHRAALKAAAQRAEVLGRISGVYVSLARRSQVLLHRQLALLDTMERRSQDPVELEDLFRLDHLTTRMRRHAESLIILSGAAPGRGWRNPVPLMDVVRAAVAEVEDFARIDVRDMPEVRIPGKAVADLTHLLAELAENAAVFSPPHTTVEVRGEPVGTGVVIEIEDRGLGMGKQALSEANARIEDSGRVDLLDTERLGLFVVNRLAHQLGARVALRTSVYGGVTAVILLPEALVTAPAQMAESDSQEGLPRRTAVRARAVEATPPARPEAPLAPPAPQGPPELPPVQVSAGRQADPPDGRRPLPRRVRETHLTPETQESQREAAAQPSRPRRSPEEARATMSALRTGWARGRRLDAQGPSQGEEGS